MTLGTRDSRKIIGRYNLTGEDVKNQARFEDSIGIFPEFIDGYNILILPTTGRYFQVKFSNLNIWGIVSKGNFFLNNISCFVFIKMINTILFVENFQLANSKGIEMLLIC